MYYDKIINKLPLYYLALFNILFSSFQYPLKPIQQEKVKVTLHGKYAKGNTAYIWVDYQQKELKIRPTYKERQAVLDCDSVILTIQEGLFGMDYVRYVAPNSD